MHLNKKLKALEKALSVAVDFAQEDGNVAAGIEVGYLLASVHAFENELSNFRALMYSGTENYERAGGDISPFQNELDEVLRTIAAHVRR